MLKRDLYYERIPTKSLRDDVRFLGNILGRVIKEQEGQKFYDLVAVSYTHLTLPTKRIV